MKFWIFLFFSFSFFLAKAETCVPQVNSCGFYLCEEKNYHCGPKGYPLGFGFKFCQAFLHSETQYSPKAQDWLRQVRVCLMKASLEVNSSETKTCGQVKKDSFRSHLGCYRDTGFCDLSKRDKLKILWTLRSSFVHREALRQAYLVTQECSSRKGQSPEVPSVQR